MNKTTKYGIYKIYMKNKKIFVGIVYNVENEFFSILTTKNTEMRLSFEDIEKVSSTRLPESVRAALINCGMAKAGIIMTLEEIEKLKKEVREREDVYSRNRQNLVTATGYLGIKSFAEKFLKTLKEDFGIDAYVSGWSNSIPYSFTIRVSKDIEKWARPEEYPFIYREYDNCCFINYNHPSYKKELDFQKSRFHFPTVLNPFKPKIALNLGDKNWLTIDCDYEIKFKGEPTLENLQKILQTIKK